MPRRATSSVGSAAVWRWFSTQRSQSSADSATTRMRMLAWDRPQNSVHWPQYSPGSSACIRSGWMRFGTASRLPFNRGIQKEWMTSRLVIDSWTSVSAGMTISPEVTMGSPSASLMVG